MSTEYSFVHSEPNHAGNSTVSIFGTLDYYDETVRIII